MIRVAAPVDSPVNLPVSCTCNSCSGTPPATSVLVTGGGGFTFELLPACSACLQLLPPACLRCGLPGGSTARYCLGRLARGWAAARPGDYDSLSPPGSVPALQCSQSRGREGHGKGRVTLFRRLRLTAKAPARQRPTEAIRPTSCSVPLVH